MDNSTLALGLVAVGGVVAVTQLDGGGSGSDKSQSQTDHTPGLRTGFQSGADDSTVDPSTGVLVDTDGVGEAGAGPSAGGSPESVSFAPLQEDTSPTGGFSGMADEPTDDDTADDSVYSLPDWSATGDETTSVDDAEEEQTVVSGGGGLVTSKDKAISVM